MTKTKILSIVLIVVTLCGLCLVFAGCPEKEKEKYDVTMKIVCREVVNGRATGPILEEWIFTPDINELHTEREFDGKQYTYYLYRYALPDHPNFSGTWYTPNSGGLNVFSHYLGFEGQMWNEEDPKFVCERRKYCLIYYAEGSSNLWNYRSIRLYINVK